MKLLWILCLFISFRANALTCSSFLKVPRPPLYSAKALMDSELLYSSYFSVTMDKVLSEISANGISEVELTRVLVSGNLADLNLIADAVYRNMENSYFPSAEAKAQFEGMPVGFFKAHIVDALLMNAKYREQVHVGSKGDAERIRENSNIVADIGIHSALPIWLVASTWSIAIDNLDVMIAGGVLTATSLASGLAAFSRSARADTIARGLEADFRDKVLEDLSTIKRNAVFGKAATPELESAVSDTLTGGRLDNEVRKPIPSILF